MQSMALVILGSPHAIQAFLDSLQTQHPFIPVTTPMVADVKTQGFCERTLHISIFFRHPVTENEIEHVLHTAEQVQIGCTSCCA
jgi:hypothetical protein